MRWVGGGGVVLFVAVLTVSHTEENSLGQPTRPAFLFVRHAQYGEGEAVGC